MMVFGNKKWVIFNFLPYEYKSLEEYLEKMAVKGWILEDIRGYYLKFTKSEPKRIRYSVDIMDSISFFDGKDTDKALEYREYCKEAGWNFVCESDKIQIYSSELDNIKIDIHTDEAEKFNNISKASLKYIFLKLITIILLLYSQYIGTVGSDNGHFLASSLSLSSLIFVSLLSIHEIIGLVTFFRFFIKGKISLKKEEKINYNFKGGVLFKRLIYNLAIIGAIITFIYLAIETDIFILKLMIAMISLIFVFNYIINFIKNKNYKNKIVVISVTYLILIILMIFVMTNMLFRNIGSTNDNEKSIDEVTLNLEDFNDVNKDDSEYFRGDKSPIAKYIFYSNEGNKMYLSYELFESKYKWPVKYNFNKEINSSKEFGISYIEKETNLSKDIKVYVNEERFKYIIISENKMIEIYEADSVREDELINIVYEKVFK